MLALSAALLLALAGCGGDDDESTGATTAAETAGTTTEAASGTALKIGLVTDIGGLDDRSFNFLANQGLDQAEDDLGVEGRVVISRSNADYVPNLTSLAKAKYDLVIAVGFLMADALDTVAKQFPDTNFAIIDFAQEEMKSKPKNVRGLLFKEQEAGYLVGYLAGLVTKQEGGSQQVVGSVGGLKIPPVDRYIAGYRAGAKKASPGITTLNAYSQDFVDQAKCKELALDQIARGAHVIFQVAGQCGLGALSAAKEKNVRGIGVDADQSYLGEPRPHERSEEGRRRGLSDGAGRGGRVVLGRDEHHLRRCLGRGRARQDRPRRPGRHRRAGQPHPGSARRG